jgi:TetR/AcrR family transcriptional repressor of nem operon
MAATSPAFRERLRATFEDIAAPVRICLDRAVEEGELARESDTGELAEFIVSSWQGALLSLKVADSGRPLELFEKFIFDHLLDSGTGSRGLPETGREGGAGA